MQTEWRSVTPFDPLLAIRQKRGGEAPPEDPAKTRENRITAVGNDLYSADSRSFLNPFLRISRCARLFPLLPSAAPLSIELPPRLLPSRPRLSSIPLHPVSRETCVEVSRALHVSAKRKLFCLANHARSLSLSSHTANHRPRYAHSHAFSARRMFIRRARKHRYPILLLRQ